MRKVIKFREDDSLISLLTFAKLGLVDLDNYTRPTDWFRLLDDGVNCHLPAPLCPGSYRRGGYFEFLPNVEEALPFPPPDSDCHLQNKIHCNYLVNTPD